MKKWLIGLLALTMAAGLTQAGMFGGKKKVDADGSKMKCPQSEFCKSLSEEQQAKAKEICEKFGNEAKQIREDTRQKMDALKDKEMAAIREILTDEQKVEFDAKAKVMKEKREMRVKNGDCRKGEGRCPMMGKKDGKCAAMPECCIKKEDCCKKGAECCKPMKKCDKAKKCDKKDGGKRYKADKAQKIAVEEVVVEEEIAE